MKTYKIFKAMLQYNKPPVFVAEFEAKNILEVKEKLRSEYNLNPFYSIIVNMDKKEIVKNEHCPTTFDFLKDKH